MGLNAPVFSSRQPVQFICPDNTALNITTAAGTLLSNNPKAFYIQPGDVGKIDLGINGQTYFRGDGEYAPFAIELTWDELGYNDYLNLAALRPYGVHFISHRNQGYWGKLRSDGPKNPKANTSDIVSTKATFYVLAPSDAGGAATVNRIDPSAASFTVNNAANSGYMASGTTNYYWLTFWSIWGETTSVASGAITSGTNSKNVLSWTWPAATGYCTQATLYCSNLNNQSTAKLCAEVINGEPSFWNDLVGYPGLQITQTPSLVNNACRGQWQMGTWVNES